MGGVREGGATRIAYLGYLLALLAMPIGVVSLAAFGAMLLLAVWAIEEAEARAGDRRLHRRQRRTRPSRRIEARGSPVISSAANALTRE